MNNVGTYDNSERVCPRCGEKYAQYPAVSRRDNKTYICPECGIEEAMNDFFHTMKGEVWKEKRELEKQG